MKMIITSIKFSSYLKGSVFLVAMWCSSQVSAEYYEACGAPCCGVSCGTVVRARAVQQIYAPPVKRVKYYRHTRSLSGYNMEVYYVWPTFVGAVWAPACGGGCVQPAMTCGGPSCGSFYVPPEYYTSVTNAYEFSDERTADDF